MLLSLITRILMTVTWKFWFALFFFYSTFVFLIYSWMTILNLIQDLKLKLKSQFFLCCHCNVNSLYTHDKSSMLEAYNIAQKYDLSLKGYIILLTRTILMMLREGVFVCTTRKTYPLGLSALLTSINVYYVKWLVRI